MTLPIDTQRLRLRAFASGDLDALVRIAGNRAIADTTISVPHPFTPDQAARWIADHSAIHPGDVNLGFAVAGKNDAMLGYVGLHQIDREHLQAEISFWIDPAEQGKGFAAEAACAAIDYAFGSLGLNRLCAYHMVRNTASEALLAKLGFEPEGLLRQRVRKWGKFEDVKAWALLAPKG